MSAIETTRPRFGRYETCWERLPLADKKRYSGWSQYYAACRAHFGAHMQRVAATTGQNISPDIPGMTDAAACVAECLWYSHGKPYYNLWPGYVTMLSNTNVANIPSKYLRLPHAAFLVNLPDGFVNMGDGFAKSILVSEGASRVPGKALQAVWLMVQTSSPRFEGGGWLCTTIPREDGTVEDQLSRVQYDGVTLDDMRRVARIAITTALLAISVHRKVDHDVIAGLRERYDNAKTDQEREYLAMKSRQRGVFGENLGRGRCLALTTPHGEPANEGGGRELNWQHIRGAHFHTYWTGKNRDVPEIKFIEPIVVRPDLPTKPTSEAA